jgi:hypothetical protein
MTVSRLLISALLTSLLAMPGAAQRSAPAALRMSDAPAVALDPWRGESRASASTTLPSAERQPGTMGGILGGLGGVVIGTLVGTLVGAQASQGCHGEDCQLVGMGLGVIMIEPVALAVGAHLGSRSTRHDRLLLTSVASLGLMAGAVYTAAALPPGGMIALPLIPALQLITVLAIERH